MSWRIFLISLILMFISLLITGIPSIKNTEFMNKIIEIGMDNFIMFVISVIGFISIFIGNKIDSKNLKKEIKLQNNKIKELELRNNSFPKTVKETNDSDSE